MFTCITFCSVDGQKRQFKYGKYTICMLYSWSCVICPHDDNSEFKRHLLNHQKSVHASSIYFKPLLLQEQNR